MDLFDPGEGGHADKQPADPTKLVLALPVFGGGLWDYSGDFDELENDFKMNDALFEALDKLFCPENFQPRYSLFREDDFQLRQVEIMKLEGAFG